MLFNIIILFIPCTTAVTTASDFLQVLFHIFLSLQFLGVGAFWWANAQPHTGHTCKHDKPQCPRQGEAKPGRCLWWGPVLFRSQPSLSKLSLLEAFSHQPSAIGPGPGWGCLYDPGEWVPPEIWCSGCLTCLTVIPTLLSYLCFHSITKIVGID